MTDLQTFYLLAALGVVAHILGKLYQRTGTLKDWWNEQTDGKYLNRRYVVVTVLATAVTALIGPGDGVSMGTATAKIGAFSIAAMGCEAIRVMILGPAKTAERKAAKG